MQRKSLPILNVSIHFPSCKSEGFLSDDFAEEIKKSIPEYEFKFSFVASPKDAFFPAGISTFSGENIATEESKKLMNKFQQLFSNLSLKRTS